MDLTKTKTQTPPVTATLRGYSILLASTLLLSTTGVLMKGLLTDYGMESLALAFWRAFLVCAAAGVALTLSRRSLLRIRPRDLPLFALFGFVGVGLHQLMWLGSLQGNGVAVATVLIYIQPALVAVFSWQFLHERIDRTRLLALLLSLAGMVLVSRAYEISNLQLNFLGILAGLGSGCTYATYALMGRVATRRYNPWTAVLYAFFFGALFLLPFQLFVHNPLSLGASVGGWSLLLFLAIGPTLGGFGLYTVGLTHLPLSVATIIATLEPVFSIIWAYLLFGETLNLLQIVGAALILWSVLMLRPR